MVAPTMKQNIVIYNDEGVGEFGLSCLIRFFEGHDVVLADAKSIIAGDVFKDRDVFVMPGGADLPYCKKLNGLGNKNIRSFVENGGTYLGICAGAYYACRSIEYHKGREDEICGPRELAFVDCVAVGSIPQIAPYYDDTLKSAAITKILLGGGEIIDAYYHGGCHFNLCGHETNIVARYEGLNFKPPAIITQKINKGRVILSGLHLEASNTHLGEFKNANVLLKELIK